MASNYLILLEEDVAVDPRKYGPLVAPALGVTAVEGRMAVRKGRGIFLENLDEGHALRLAAELAKDAIRSRVVSRDQFPPLPLPRKVLHLEHGAETLVYEAGERGAVPWDAILVASIGVVARPAYQELFAHVPFSTLPALHKLDAREREIVRENLILKMGAPPPPGAGKKAPRSDSIFEEIDKVWGMKVSVYADLLTSDLNLWLRVPMDEMAYRVLEGGVKMGGCWGLQLLVKDLLSWSRPALTPGSLKLLAAADIRELVFPQIEEFTRLTAWTALMRFLWPTAASSSPSPGPPASSTEDASSSASPELGPPSTSP